MPKGCCLYHNLGLKSRGNGPFTIPFYTFKDLLAISSNSSFFWSQSISSKHWYSRIIQVIRGGISEIVS